MKNNGSKEPYFETNETRDYFLTTIYIREGFEKASELQPDEISTENLTENLNKTQLKIIELMRKNANITQISLAKKLNISRTAIALNIKELKNIGYVERIGSDKKGYWKIKK